MSETESTATALMETTAQEFSSARSILSTAPAAITSVESLRRHLQWAIELEHATIPPYLCALYSIKPGHNREAVELISSVVIEEMLHLTLAANLLNAVGGEPRLDVPSMLPGYPHPLPHSDRSFQISLLAFGLEAIENFLKIEQPSRPSDPPEDDDYETIGQFYQAIEAGLRNLTAIIGEKSLFSGISGRQVTDQHVYSGGGHIFAVSDLTSALAALREIVEQGEGASHDEVWDGDDDVFHPGHDQVAHYYRFQELKFGRRYRKGDTPDSGPSGDPVSIDWEWGYPMRANPKVADHPSGSPIRLAQDGFNYTYCSLLEQLEVAFSGNPQKLNGAIGAMYTLKSQAQELMQMTTEDGLTTAGPSFEYVTPENRVRKWLSTQRS